MIKLRYFLLRIKILAAPFFLTLFLLAVAGSLFFGFMLNDSDEEGEREDNRFKVGIVGDTDSRLLGFAIDFIENADEVNEYITICIFENEEQAYNAIEKGNVVGCIFFTEEFLDAVTSGENLPLKYVTRKTTVDLASAVVNELLETVSAMVVDIQTSAFLAEDYLKSIPGFSEKKLVHKIELFLIDKVLARENTVELVLTQEKGISLGGYYFSSLTVLIILILGIVFGVYLVRGRNDLYRLLNSNRCNAFYQVLSEVASFFLFVWLLCSASFIAIGAFSESLVLLIPELSEIGTVSSFEMLLKITPVIFLLCIMQFFLYSMFKNVVSGLLTQVVVSIGLGYVSGCFYPSSFFPKGFTALVNILPVGNAFNYVQNVLCTNTVEFQLVLCLVWSVVLFFACVFLRRNSIKAGGCK